MADSCHPSRLNASTTSAPRRACPCLRVFIFAVLVAILTRQKSLAAQEITVAFANSHAQFTNLFTRFTEETGIAVKSEFIDTSAMRPELLLRANRQQLPDAVIFSADNLSTHAFAFSEVKSNLFNAKLNAQARAMVEFEGAYLGVPVLVGNHLMLYYNKELLNEAPEALPNSGGGKTGRQPRVAFNYGSMYWFMSFVGACDGFPIQGGSVRLDTPEMQAALRLYSNLAKGGAVDSRNKYSEAKDSFLKGQVPCLIDGDWAYGELAARFGKKLGIAGLPSIGGRRLVSYCAAQALAFPNRSLQGPKAEPLRRFAEFMQSAEVQRQIWREIGALPVRDDSISELMSSGNEQLKDVYRAYQTATPLPLDASMAVVWEAMYGGFVRYSGGWYDAPRTTAYMQHLATVSTDAKAVANTP